MVQNLYSERELSIKLLLGEKTRKKTNISPFRATHTYIKLTFVIFFPFFFAPFPELNSVLGFVYHGEANIAKANLSSFLALAEELEVKGLRDKDWDKGGDSGQTPHPPASARSMPQPHQLTNNSEKFMKAEPRFDPQEGTAEVKDVRHRKPGIRDVHQYEDYGQYEDYNQNQGYNQEESYNQEQYSQNYI